MGLGTYRVSGESLAQFGRGEEDRRTGDLPETGNDIRRSSKR